MKCPNIMTVKSVQESANTCQAEINGSWVPCRPAGFVSVWHRLRAAWLVLVGKADALTWPEGQ
jgi:hypothetical protein